MAGKLFVFDLDDTIMDNVHDYTEPIIEMARCIIGAFGSRAPHIFTVITMEEEIDGRRKHEINPATGRPYLYSMERFPGTCVETYREIAKRAKIVPDAEVEAKLWNIGMGAFDERRYVKNVNPEALSALDFLKKQGIFLKK